MKNNIIVTDAGYKYKRVSNWLSIRYGYITKRHSLAYFADFYGCDDEKGTLDYFVYKGKKYAIGQFAKFPYPEFFENEDGKKSWLSGVDSTECFKPLIIEFNDSCGAVRLYQNYNEN